MPNGCGCCGRRNYSVCCYSNRKSCCKTPCCPPAQYCCPTTCCMPMQARCYTISRNRGCCNNRRHSCCGH